MQGHSPVTYGNPDDLPIRGGILHLGGSQSIYSVALSQMPSNRIGSVVLLTPPHPRQASYVSQEEALGGAWTFGREPTWWLISVGRRNLSRKAATTMEEEEGSSNVGCGCAATSWLQVASVAARVADICRKKKSKSKGSNDDGGRRGQQQRRLRLRCDFVATSGIGCSKGATAIGERWVAV
ncbi:hypothetical protein BHM03_00020685 [Ensete ventricosum]|nr:hypothetical protein BHM03_00020685 [Ensete ventricosum]